MSNIQLGSSNIAAGFVDLATFDEPEKFCYGGANATVYFVRATRKSTWFTQIPTLLAKSAGMPGFNQEWSVAITRAGDYLLHTWLRVDFPSVTLLAGNQFGADGRLRWTRKLMHNLVREANISFNDLSAARLDSYYLDFWIAFTQFASKEVGYNNMIGDIPQMTSPRPPNVAIPEQTLYLPIPFFFTRDKGVALPTAAIPYNDMRMSFVFRNWTELLILDNVASQGVQTTVPAVGTDIATEPVLGTTQVWANYAIVSSDERKRMGCQARNILIEQVQTAPKQAFSPASNPNPQVDIRLSHSIKVVMFGVRNKTHPNVQSNYTTHTPVNNGNVVDYSNGYDPLNDVSVIYESTHRLTHMDAKHFALIEPYYKAPTIPTETGYHMYSYSLDFYNLDPMGSTNFGKLTNVSFGLSANTSAVTAANGGFPAGSGASYPQSYEFILMAVNNNIIAISGGALGFPVL